VAIERAMVLCAGYGTRLRPLTDERPKPLVPIGDAPLLEHIVRRLRAAGANHIVVNAHHLPERVAEEAERLGLGLVVESAILGTAGGVRGAGDALGPGEVLVVNGDILAELDTEALAWVHATARPFATLAVAEVGPMGHGTVGLDPEGRVVRLRGETFGHEVAGAHFVGAQLLSERARGRLPEEGCLVGDVYLPALRRGEDLRGTAAAGRWWDIGTPAAYLECNLAWLEAAGLKAWSGNMVHQRICIDRSVVGVDAEVAGEGALCEVVVWPGARVTAPLERAIVTPCAVVRLGNL
jgi:mannose-1-phosphate guanylyltransferase